MAGKRCVERKEAGRALMKEILTLVQLQQEGESVVATIGGFDLEYSGERLGSRRLPLHHRACSPHRKRGFPRSSRPVTVIAASARSSRLEHGGSENSRARSSAIASVSPTRIVGSPPIRSREDGDFVFAVELAEKRRQLAEVEKGLASGVEGSGENAIAE